MKKLVAPTSTLLDSLFKYLLAAVLIFVPLYPKFPIFNLPFTYVAIRAEDFLIALVWGVFLLKVIKQRKLTFPKISFQFAVFFLVALLSSVSAILITKNVQPLIVILHFLRRIEYMSVFFLIYWAGKDVGTRRYYLELSILPVIGVLLFGIAQIYFGAPVISTMDAESSKGIALTLRPGVTLNSTFAGHYDLAVYLTMILTYLATISAHIKSRIKRLPVLAGFIIILWLFMQAGSRISLFGLALSICVVTFTYRRYLLGLLLLSFVGSFVIASPVYLERFKSIFRVIIDQLSRLMIKPALAVEDIRPIQGDISTSIRFDVEWPRAMRSFYKNPLLGTGYSSISLATDNDYLRALGETGLLGLSAFMSVLIGIFRSLLTYIKKSTGTDKIIVVSALGIFVSFLSTAVFLDVFESSKIAVLFWAYMGLAFSTTRK